jgi:hypothetical protein
MAAFNTVHSLRSFGVLAPLSVLISGPAFIIVRSAARIPALSILLFSHPAIAAIVAVSINANSNSKNVTLWDTAAHLPC